MAGHVCRPSGGGHMWQSESCIQFRTLCEVEVVEPWIRPSLSQRGRHRLAAELVLRPQHLEIPDVESHCHCC